MAPSIAHARELGSQITNVLRCLYLEASGHQVTVTELVGWGAQHENELIIARYTGQKKRSGSAAAGRHPGGVWVAGGLGHALPQEQKAAVGAEPA